MDGSRSRLCRKMGNGVAQGEPLGNSPPFVLPESFHPGEFLRTPKLRSRWDDARYFISMILRKVARRDVDDLGVVRLHAKHLKAIMAQSDYAAVIDALVDGGAVERFPYQVGERSFGYRLAARFVADRHVRIPAIDPRLIRRLQKFHGDRAAERQAHMKPVHHALAAQQVRLQIHGDRAREILSGLPQSENRFDVQNILIRDIEDHEFRLSVGQYGRVSNSITSLKRELRDELHVDGRKLGSVDLSCCQPAFVAKLMQDASPNFPGSSDLNLNQGPNSEFPGFLRTDTEGKDTREATHAGQPAAPTSNYDPRLSDPVHYDSRFAGTRNADFGRYLSLVQSGGLYEVLLADLGHTISRDELKRRLQKDVIAKRKASFRGGEYPSLVEDKFRERFPTVYRFIRDANRDGYEHSNLIRRLQREESKLVIEGVAADLLTRHPGAFFITLHDAIYTTAEHLPKVEQAFRHAFEAMGFPMKFKTTFPTSREVA